MERCRACGMQAIACGCVYEVNGIDWETMEETHPDIYRNGPTDEMVAKFFEKYPDRLPWTGEYPGSAECREFGLWCLWGPDMDPPRQGWVSVPPGTPGASENLNRLYSVAEWDVKVGRLVLRPGFRFLAPDSPRKSG